VRVYSLVCVRVGDGFLCAGDSARLCALVRKQVRV